MKSFLKVFIFVVFLPVNIYALEGVNDLLEGFGESEPVKIEKTEKQKTDFDFTTSISVYSSYGINNDAPVFDGADWQGFNSLRTKISQDIKYKPSNKFEVFASGFLSRDSIFDLKGRDDYNNSLLSDRETEAEFTSSYILFTPFENMDIKAGRQIVVWGKSDNIRVTDVLNPMDKREPGLTDIEDLRLPRAMTKIDFYKDRFNLSLIAVHENREDKIPKYNSGFYALPFLINNEKVHDGGSETEFALALNGVFSGWDLSLYAARIHDNEGYLKSGVLKHDFIEMTGFSFNMAFGSWLLKSEGALFFNKKYSLVKDEKIRGDILLGTEFSGFDNTTISFEIVNRHIFDYEDEISDYSDKLEDEIEKVIRVNRTFFNERLDLTWLSYFYRAWADGGGVSRVEASWEQTDRLTLRFGSGFYNGGSIEKFEKIKSNDRIFAELKYVF